jgi:hypothetical protein
MKRMMWLTVLLSLAGLLLALDGTIPVSNQTTRALLQSNTQEGLTVNYNVGSLHYREVGTAQGDFTEISIEGYAFTNRTGLPQLPLLRKIIRVPLQAQILPRVTGMNTTNVSLAAMGVNGRVLPRQESVAKNQDPALLPFKMDRSFYNGTAWSDEPTVKVEEIGMLRGARLVALDFAPVRYNPASAQLEVITSATVEVTYAGADWAATDELYERYYSPVFEPVIAQTAFNYTSTRTSLDRYPLGLIIITPASFVTTLQPFVDWKTKQGYEVTVATTAVTGTTTTAIKTYLQNIWNAATTTNPAPSYLLIVGDTGQVPAWTGSTGGHVTDLNYVKLQGTDFVPEMYYGRFSATTTAQVQAYVDKTVQYESFTMPDPSYLSNTVLIAGVDSYYGNSHANGQINYGKTNYFGESTNPAWTPFGPYNIRNRMYYYPASGSAESSILSDMSSGIGFINYTAHGDVTYWHDPRIDIPSVNALTNANKYFVAIGNACLTNSFDSPECFGEAITRVTNKGAVAYVGGTNSTYWDEDYYWSVGYKPPVVSTGSPYIANRIGAYDAVFHYHDEAFADWASTMGSYVFMGNLAVTASNSSRINYYWEIYSIMGDPSLTPYMGIPTPINAQFAPTVQLGMSTMQITADPYTYVAISKDGVLHGSGLTNASGALTLSIEPFTSPGTAQLVMTRSLRQPLVADVQVTTSSGPYLLVSNMTVNDGNNSIAESGETLYLNVTLNNVGTAVASNVTATLTTTNPHVNILAGTANVASVPVNNTVNINNTFQIAILPSITDQAVVLLHFNITDGTNNWTADRNITVNAPNLSFSSATFFDPNNNNAFEPGEMITASFNLTNTGSMNAPAGLLEIIINSDYGTASQYSFTLPGINSGVSIPLNLQITIANNAPAGTTIPVGLALTAGAQLVNGMFALTVGMTGIGFETGSLDPMISPSTIPWTVLSGSANAHSGSYGAKSGAIGNNGMTEMYLTLNVSAAGNISFWRKVSSESGYDFLRFYIDSNEMGSWSGEQVWAQQTYAVTPGEHTFKWAYIKDYSTVGGSDCAWIDDITLPITGNTNVPIYYQSQTALNFSQVPLNTTVSQNLVVRNLGSVAMTGTITVPSLVNLLFNGAAVTDTYNYSIPANSNGTFTISLYLTAQTTFNGNISITSNDPNLTSQQISLHVDTSTANEDPLQIPEITSLQGNFPNPFNPETTIRFGLKQAGRVSIEIYNTKGQHIRTLVSDKLKAGYHSAVWNGTDSSGKAVSSGMYLYRMQTEGFAQTRKMMLMK